MNKETVSVVMPTYNAERYLQKAIDSILNQSYENLELLIGNDGSTDTTCKILNRISDPRVILVNSNINLGNQITTNILFSKARGQYYAIQDADDWSDLNRLEKQLKYLRENSDIGVVGSDIEQVSMENCKFPDRYHEFDTYKLNSNLLAYQELPFTWATIMFRRSIYEKNGGFREYFNRLGAGDIDWVYRASFLTRLHIMKDKLYYVRRHFDSFTKAFNPDPRKLISSKIALRLYMQRLKNGYDDLDRNPELLDKWVKEHLHEYYEDPSRIFFKYADTELLRKRPANALPPTIRAFLARPFSFRNIKQLIFTFLSLIFPGLLRHN